VSQKARRRPHSSPNPNTVHCQREPLRLSSILERIYRDTLCITPPIQTHLSRICTLIWHMLSCTSLPRVRHSHLHRQPNQTLSVYVPISLSPTNLLLQNRISRLLQSYTDDTHTFPPLLDHSLFFSPALTSSSSFSTPHSTFFSWLPLCLGSLAPVTAQSTIVAASCMCSATATCKYPMDSVLFHGRHCTASNHQKGHTCDTHPAGQRRPRERHMVAHHSAMCCDGPPPSDPTKQALCIHTKAKSALMHTLCPSWR